MVWFCMFFFGAIYLALALYWPHFSSSDSTSAADLFIMIELVAGISLMAVTIGYGMMALTFILLFVFGGFTIGYPIYYKRVRAKRFMTQLPPPTAPFRQEPNQ